LGKQKFDSIYVGRMPDDSGISPEQPKEKDIDKNQTSNKIKMMGCNYIP